MNNIKYAGFWIRVLAALIDTAALFIVIIPLLYFIYGGQYFSDDRFFKGTWDVLLNYIFPILAVLLFWQYRSATPGKIILKLKIVDKDDLEKVSFARLLLRYIGYYLSIFPLLLGLIWVGIDKKKQGWHDKISNTVVIYDHRK